jgi:hypothetical protein
MPEAGADVCRQVAVAASSLVPTGVEGVWSLESGQDGRARKEGRRRVKRNGGWRLAEGRRSRSSWTCRVVGDISTRGPVRRPALPLTSGLPFELDLFLARRRRSRR